MMKQELVLKEKLPDGWKWSTINDLADKTINYPVGDGDHGQIKPSYYQKQGIPYIRVADIVNEHLSKESMVYISLEVHNANLKSELKPNDIIIAKTGATIGKVAIIPSDIKIANTTSSIGKVTLDTNICLPKFLWYFMQSKTFKKQMYSVSVKSAQPGFNIIDLKKFRILLPPLPVQKQIVAKLDAQMAQIEIMKKEAEKEKGASEIIELSFLREIFNNVKSKSKEIKLGEVATFTMGGTPPPEEINSKNAQIPWIKGSDIHGEYIHEAKNFITEKGMNLSRARYYDIGTIIIGRAGQGKTRGTTAILKFRTTTNETVIAIFPDKDKTTSEYIHYNLKSRYQELRNIGGENQRAGITQTNLERLPFLLPSLDIQKKITKEIIEFSKEIMYIKETIKKKLEAIEELPSSLLNEVFGKYDIPEEK